MLKTFFKMTFRNLWKNKTYSLLNIFGLAIGIACAGLIFLWVEDEVTYDSANIKKDRLYSLRVNFSYAGNIFTNSSTPRPMGPAIKDEIPGIANICRISDENENQLFTIGDKPVYASGRYTDSSLFSMFTLPFVQGNAENAFKQLYSIVLTEKSAKKFFGDNKNIVGKTIRRDNKQDYVVTGVLKDLPENSSLQFEWLVSYQAHVAQNKSENVENDEVDWGSYGPFTYVELNSSASLASVNKQLYNYIHQKDSTQKSHAFLFSMNDWHLRDHFENGKQTSGGRIEQVRMLSVIAWIILFIACINFMNLATARSEKRAREVGVRKVMGAGKKTLIAQFIGEALCMSALAAIAALILIAIALPAFNTLVQKNLLLDIKHPAHFIALLIIVLICGFVAGSYPSFYLSSFNPINVLKGLKIKTGGATIIRKGLVVLQFTISVVFIISTIIIYLQIQHVKNRNLGFNKNNLIEIDMQHDVAKYFPVIKQDLFRTGLVENAALSDHSTLYAGNSTGGFKWQGKAPGNEVSISFRNVSPEFISTSGMHIIEGSDFNTSSDRSSAIINETLEKIMGNESAVGKIIQSQRGNENNVYTNLTVVGVVKDYVFGDMYGKPGPVLFFCRPPEDANLIYVRTKAQSNTEQALVKIAGVMKKDNPAYPLEYKFVDDQFNQMFLSEMLMGKLANIFAALAIIISCLGLFGLAAYTAERRTKEIGIRKVLGASVRGIAGLLSKDFLQLVIISCLVAFPFAWWMMHIWLQNYQYRIEVRWWIFLIAGAVAILVALLTVSFQAIKAAIANPVKSLRTE
jgi:predicted permease